MKLRSNARQLMVEAETPEEVAVLSALAARLRARGLRLPGEQVQTLQAVRSSGGLSAAELASRLGIELSTASMRLKRLHEQGLVLREPRNLPLGREYVYRLPETETEPTPRAHDALLNAPPAAPSKRPL